VQPERDVRGEACAAQPDHLGRVDLDAEVPADHEVRAIAAIVDKLDLRGLYAEVRARGESAGAPATDPKILLGLWVYATSDGVGSGREIARLVELHAAYRWLCGGVAVAYHRLNDFRSDHGDVFSELVTDDFDRFRSARSKDRNHPGRREPRRVTQLLARLMKHDLIDLQRVAQDGTRIRASAGAASFRSGETLERLMTEARAHLVEVTRAATDHACTAATPRRWRA
jgi:transposase